MKETVDLRMFVPQARQFVESLRDHGITIHTAILDNWRGVRVIVNTPEVRACKNECDTCRLHEVLGESDSCEPRFESRLFRWQDAEDKYWYGPAACLQCKTPQQYLKCFANCLREDPALDAQSGMDDEVGLIKSFIVLCTDETGGERMLEMNMKWLIIYRAAGRLWGDRRAKFELALVRHGWDSAKRRFI